MAAKTVVNIRRGTYYDSVVLMQLQAALARLTGVLDAGVVMGTEANQALLAQSGLDAPEIGACTADDLLIVVRADDTAAAQAALDQVDALLARRQSALEDEDYLPQTLETAARMLPEAQWVLISAPGRYAAGVAREALRLNKNVFLYSDNVPVADEVALKKDAAQRGLLVMGPDCGTAIVNGVGLGFANRVRRGPIGLIGASGTGLQQASVRIHQLGGGITHVLGTGGRDLSEAVGAITATQALDLLARDPETRVIVLISKPPAPSVAADLLEAARETGKPVVADFIGHTAAARSHSGLHFAATLDQAAEIAVKLSKMTNATLIDASGFARGQQYLRGLFSGGTLAYEAQFLLQKYVSRVFSNAPLEKVYLLESSLESREHTVLDLGEDEFTVGRLHPMLDNTLRIQRLAEEAKDPEAAVILLDVVLGEGAHPDPALELAPAIQQARQQAADDKRRLEVITLVVGTDEDPQGMAAQIERLQAAGARVETSNEEAVRAAGELIQAIQSSAAAVPRAATQLTSRVDLGVLREPLAAINVGLEAFTASLKAQGAPVIHVRWRPPAGGNDKLMSILERMKQRQES